MTNWLISANKLIYDHEGSFKKNGYIDWMQLGNYEIGDIIFIYLKGDRHKFRGRIVFKAVVEKINMSIDEITSDKEFWYKESDYENKKSTKYARLRFIQMIDNPDLLLDELKKHGLKNPPQRVKKIDGELKEYIEKYFN